MQPAIQPVFRDRHSDECGQPSGYRLGFHRNDMAEAGENLAQMLFGVRIEVGDYQDRRLDSLLRQLAGGNLAASEAIDPMATIARSSPSTYRLHPCQFEAAVEDPAPGVRSSTRRAVIRPVRQRIIKVA